MRLRATVAPPWPLIHEDGRAMQVYGRGRFQLDDPEAFAGNKPWP